MKAKHTPGPWTIDTSLHIYAQGAPRYVGHGCTERQSIHVATATNAQDALLCAAAPDMLVALEGCVAFLEAWAVECLNSKVKRETLCRAFGGQAYHARAAIAKARGAEG